MREFSACKNLTEFAACRPRSVSGLFDEPFLAPGTGDGNFAFSPGNTDGLAAFGTGVVPILPILQTVENHKKLPVFLIPLVGIFGQAPENGPEHQSVAQQPENDRGYGSAQYGRQNAAYQRGKQQHDIQPVGSISAGHKTPERSRQPGVELLELAQKCMHTLHPVWIQNKKTVFCNCCLYYIAFCPECNRLGRIFTDCLRFEFFRGTGEYPLANLG